MRETRDRAQYAQPASPVLLPVTFEGDACRTLYAVTKESDMRSDVVHKQRDERDIKRVYFKESDKGNHGDR